MPTPRRHQIEGALFLADRKAALLADEPRVGKTGAAIRACDYIFARKILVITTASGRPNWGREFKEWGFPRTVQVVYKTDTVIRQDADVVIVGWSAMKQGNLLDQLSAQEWEVIISDESHYAKSPDAQRTKALYGTIGASAGGAAWWFLTGTPTPNAPCDLYPMLRYAAPERVAEFDTYDKFLRHFCTVRPRWFGGRKIDVVTGGKNIDELRKRIEGFWLRRTQQDVGIGAPIYGLFTVHADSLPDEENIDARAVLAAAEAGDTATLDMHLGTLRRVTGEIVARLVVEAVTEELDNGLDRIVLMAWHTDVIDILAEGLSSYGVVVLDGRTQPAARDKAQRDFREGKARVFVGQIKAAGENIDLSASCNLMFVEMSFVPADMKQASLRITNLGQTRQCLVRVCALEGSIYEALARIVTRKVATIKQLTE